MSEVYLNVLEEFCLSIGVEFPNELRSPAELTVDEVRVSLFHDERVADDLLISASVCEIPDSNREGVLSAMLAFNYHCSQTTQPVISLGPDGKTVMISFSTALSGLNSELLTESISNLLGIRKTLALAIEDPEAMQELIDDSDDEGGFEDEVGGESGPDTMFVRG